MTSSTTTPTYLPGDLLRVAYTFTDGVRTKTRPAVVLSPQQYHESRDDIIMMPLSTQAGGYYGDRPLQDWQAAGINGPTYIKAVIQTIPQSSVMGTFGQLTEADRAQVREIITEIIDVI